jgi:hypothetical protein
MSEMLIQMKKALRDINKMGGSSMSIAEYSGYEPDSSAE